MSNDQVARDLLNESSNYHENLIQLVRGIRRFQEIMDFIVKCIDFADKYIPKDRCTSWLDSNPYIPLINKRSSPLFTFTSPYPLTDLTYLLSSTTSGSTGSFTFLMENYQFYETKVSRKEFLDLSLAYKGMLGRPEDIEFALFLSIASQYRSWG